MKTQSSQIQQYVIKHVKKHPNDIVSQTMQHFNVSRTTVLRHIQHLIKANKLIKTGTTKQMRYTLLDHSDTAAFIFSLDQQFDEFQKFQTYVKPHIDPIVNANTYAILEYTITEMLNNSRDHSRGKNVTLNMRLSNDNITITIHDDGIGVLNSLASILKTSDYKEIIFELSKGKLTSDLAHHSGEGIFFTSRATDQFMLRANGYLFARDNLLQDWTFHACDKQPGTQITLVIQRYSPRELINLFQAYQDDESCEFNKTDILVNLAPLYGSRLISRSQAKRVTQHLEQFTCITLDFKHVEAVGQGFVDELFRIYQNIRPTLTIKYKHASEDVDFMIKRTLKN